MSGNEIKKCVLESLNSSFPSIILNGNKNIIGRSPLTQIRDEFCSREQMFVKANLKEEYIQVKNLGINPSGLNGFALKQNVVYEAFHGDIIEVLLDKYMYKVKFDSQVNEPIKHLFEQKQQQTSDTFCNESSLVSLPACHEAYWEEYEKHQLYIFTSLGVKPQSKIASYDMDGTLIKTVSGNVFPKTLDDWQIALPEIPLKLRSLYNEGYKIVIFTNQGAIGSGKLKLADFKRKLEDIITKLDVPIQAFVAPSRSIYRKPMIGMWNTLVEYSNGNLQIDTRESFYVGDAAGRPEINGINKRKKDHSCADRLMALNAELPFFTPEEHFQNAKTSSWTRPEFDPTNLVIAESLYEPRSSSLLSNHVELILMVGCPGSGKSHFANTYLKPAKYTIINRDQLGSWQKCAQAVENCLKNSKSCCVDNTNVEKHSRKRLTKIAKDCNVKCRCFLMSTSIKHCMHNNLFRELTDTTHDKISDMVMNSFKKKYSPPVIEEGFNSILTIHFIPSFKNEEEEKLYKMYLLDK